MTFFDEELKFTVIILVKKSTKHTIRLEILKHLRTTLTKLTLK